MKTTRLAPPVLAALLLVGFGCGGSSGPRGTGGGGGGAGGLGGAGGTGGGGGAGGLGGAGGTGGTGGASGAKNAEEFCNQYWDALLDLIANCGGVSRPLVETLIAPDYVCSILGKGQAAGRLTFEKDDAATCLSTVRAVSCADFSMPGSVLAGATMPSSGAVGTDAAGCMAALVGQVATGGACYDDAECMDGDHCQDHICPGTCVTIKNVGEACGSFDRCESDSACADGFCVARALAGGACSGPGGAACAANLYCSGVDSTAGTCMATQASGSCTAAGQCAAKHACKGLDDSGSSPTPGTCTPIKAIGDACTVGAGDCFPLTGFCSETTNKCTDYPTAGDPCGLLGGELVLCVHSYCDGLMAGTCRDYLPPGGNCDPNQMESCGPGHTCDDAMMKCVSLCSI